MGTALSVVVFYVLPALLAFFFFYWSELPSRVALPARLVAVLGVFSLLGSLGLVAQYGAYATTSWSAGAILGALAALPKLADADNLGDPRDLLRNVGLAVGGVVCVVVGMTLAAQARNADAPASLVFPLKTGEYLVLGGGGGLLGIDAHGGAQLHGVDIVRVDRAGFRKASLFPSSSSEFFIFDDVVTAPCDGNIVALEDDREDLPPTRADSVSPLGNYIAIACPDITVVLAHLKRASLAVPRNTGVRVGDALARVGASGHAGQAKLRIYAVKGQEQIVARLIGQATPVPITFGEGPLVRGDRVSR